MTLRNRLGAARHPVASGYREIVARQAADRLQAVTGKAATATLPNDISIPELPMRLRNGHVVVGDFDGAHRAHSEAVNYAWKLGRLHGGPVIALSYERATHTSGFRLTDRDETARLLVRAGADVVVTIRASNDRPMTPTNFVSELLKGRLHAKSITVSHEGSEDGSPPVCIPAIAEAAPLHGISVHILPPVFDPDPISSTRVRLALSGGDVESASRLLGRYWSVEGVVSHGAKRGRELGMPTANIALAANVGLMHGVYAVRALAKDKVCEGVASFGRRPQFDDGDPLLEVHLFDFGDDLYDQKLRVEFVGWLRGEEKFSSVESLKDQMTRDVIDAQQAIGCADRNTKSALNWTEPMAAHHVEL
jgi:riboflavin kinase/FMN adenylyltransferase